MDNFELKLTKEVAIPGEISTNIGELDKLIAEKEDLAKSLVVTDDLTQVDAADKDAAEIGKMEKQLSRFRIDFIKKWKKPVEAFEIACKGYEKRLNAAAALLRTKTAEVKTGWKLKRRETYNGVWLGLIAERNFDERVAGSGHFERFFGYWTSDITTGNWLNKSATDEKIRAAMKTELDRVAEVVKTVRETYSGEDIDIRSKAEMEMVVAFCLEDVIKAVNAYKHELAELAARKAEAEAKAKAEAEAKARAEEEAKARLAAKREAEARAQAEADARNQADAAQHGEPVQAAPVATTTAPASTQAAPSPKAEPTYKLTLTFTGSLAAFNDLKKYLETSTLTNEKVGEFVKI